MINKFEELVEEAKITGRWMIGHGDRAKNSFMLMGSPGREGAHWRFYHDHNIRNFLKITDWKTFEEVRNQVIDHSYDHVPLDIDLSDL